MLEPDQLGGHVGHLSFTGRSLDEGEHVGQDLVCVIAVGADTSHGELCQLPSIALTDLGGGHLELLAQTAQEPAHHLPLGFERAAVGEVKGEAQDSDNHWGLPPPGVRPDGAVSFIMPAPHAGLPIGMDRHAPEAGRVPEPDSEEPKSVIILIGDGADRTYRGRAMLRNASVAEEGLL